MLREQNRRIGAGLVIVGLVLLVSLRWWTSPLVRRITGRGGDFFAEFLLIPVLLAFVGAGILLLLWEPGPAS
ncbi:MAG: hypothetical protein ABEJ92_08395 [Halobacteriales archaeon]